MFIVHVYNNYQSENYSYLLSKILTFLTYCFFSTLSFCLSLKVFIFIFLWMSIIYSVHEILLSFDNLDAVANSKNDDVELMFDITDYKATKEVFVWCWNDMHVSFCFVIKRQFTQLWSTIPSISTIRTPKSSNLYHWTQNEHDICRWTSRSCLQTSYINVLLKRWDYFTEN